MYLKMAISFHMYIQMYGLFEIYLLCNISIYCFVHPIFSSFVFWYFDHFSCVIFFPFFPRLAHLALQKVNKNYVIFSYFHNFIAKSDQKPKTKNGMNETFVYMVNDQCLSKKFWRGQFHDQNSFTRGH